ncbi:MAG TPA: HYR domain-containing protein, partial [Lacibacter sp.]|nr:HYR domain-containing protein [Lacibacter sp.]
LTKGDDKQLGCNPTNINANFVTPTFDGGCSQASVSGPVQTDGGTGCNRTRTWTWTATDCSGKQTVVAQTLSWTVDEDAPTVKTPQGDNKDLGCFAAQPARSVVEAMFKAPEFDGGCSAASVEVKDEIDLEGCDRSWKRTWTATDCSGKSTSVSQTFTWKVDETAPVVKTPQGEDKNLGCFTSQPDLDIVDDNFSAPVFDGECSEATVKVTDMQDLDGCDRSWKRTWTATDCSGKETSVSQTLTWKVDGTGPVITVTDITAGECNKVTFEAQVTDDCGKVVSVEYSHPSGTVFPVGVTTVTVTAKDECGNVSTKTFTVTIIAKPSVTLTAPVQPYCGRPDNKLTVSATGSGLTYAWSVTGNGWVITDGANTATITYTSGIGPATFTVTVTDQYGCKTTAELTLDCTPLGCSPGFWRNHKELWDNEGDYVPQRMPSGLRFTINTPLHVYFGIPNGSCGLMKDLTMGQAVNANGGGCNAFVRHAVSALLSSASFGPSVLYPSGTSDFTSLYNAIKFALSTCNCGGTLFSQLEKISQSDHAFCSDLGKQIISLNQPGGSFSSGLSVKAFPNPYEEKIVFTINSKESGRATLEVYNMQGQKIATVFDGQVKGGSIMNITYNVPVFHRENLVYIFRQNGKSESGKVMSLQY